MKLRWILALVALGILYGLLAPGRLAYAFDQSTLYVFLPALLFEASWNLSYRVMRRHWSTIAVLAGPGVVLTAIVVAGALVVIRVPLAPALLTGAILSATDPIAVVSVFRRSRAPRTLVTIVECESLFNDAVAVALYRAVLMTIALGTFTVAGIAATVADTALGAAGGAVLGVGIAFVAGRALRGNSDVRLQIVATLVCAYGAYFVADYLHCSGIFATIACGISLRRYERTWLTLRIAGDVERFWDICVLAANALVFFLAGAALQVGQVAREPLFAAACIVAIAIARVLVAELLRLWPYPRAWIGVVRVAGMRGALSLALALALPATIPFRGAIVDATFAVALVTLAASGFTLSRVLRQATS